MQNNRRSGVRAVFTLAVLAMLVTATSPAKAQNLTLAQSGSRFAGSGSAGFSTDFGFATTVNISPAYVIFDAAGNQYVSDTENNCVRKIDTTGTVTTVAGLGVPGQGDTCNSTLNSTPTYLQGLYQPTGLALDSFNNLYIADSKHNCVRKLASGATGVAALTTVVGSCGSSNSSTPSPNGLVVDASNNLYISIQDTEATPALSTYQVILEGASATSPCVMAGAVSAAVPTTCPGITSNVTLHTPSGLAIDAIGDLFIADTGNNCVREIAGLTTQQTAVGQCLNDSTGSVSTTLSSPKGLAFSPTQTLLITESSSTANNVVSYVLGSSSLTTIAGLPSGAAGPYNTSQDGRSALTAPLNAPVGITVDSSGNFFVADAGNYIIRKLSNSIVFPTTPVGSPSATLPITFIVNQSVNLSASIGSDFKITSNTCVGAITASGSTTSPTTCQVFVSFIPTRPGIREASLLLTDSLSGTTFAEGLEATGNGSLSIFTPGIVHTLAASLSTPIAVSVDSAGNSYVLESGVGPGTATLVLVPAGGGSPQTIIPAGAGLLTPSSFALDAAGNIFIADSQHGTIARYGADGSSINTGYLTGLDHPTALYADSFDNLYIAQGGTTHNVIEVYLSGLRRVIAGSGTVAAANGVPATSALFVSPSALSLGVNGILYVSDSGGHLVYAIDTAGMIHQVAGNGTTTTTTPGQATGTALLSPTSLAVDAAGDIYITDSAANLVYTVSTGPTSNGNNIAAILGTGVAGNTGDGGYSSLAQVNNPLGVAVDSSANLFVVDNGNSSVREITYPGPTLSFGTIMSGQTSPALVQSVSNVGNENLNLATPFVTSNLQYVNSTGATSCGAAVVTGATCNLAFTFSPTQNGPVNAVFNLISDSYVSPQPILLSGTGKLALPLQFTLTPQTEVYGQPFPEVVTIANGDPSPTGTITFSYGNQVLCSMTASFPPTTTCSALSSGLSVGTYPVSFAYSGDSIYPPSTLSTTLTVSAAPLTVTVNSTSRIAGAPNPVFTGTVSGVVPGDTILVSYSTVATAASPAGTYAITATLTAVSPASLTNYIITNTPGTLTITPGPPPAVTTTSLVTSGTPVVFGTNVTFTATVTASSGGVPSGTIVFSDGSTVLSSPALDGNGVATFSSSTLAIGSHTITAAFQPTATFAASTGTLTQVITAPTGSFTIVATPATQFIRGAGTTTFQIAVTSTGNFAGQVELACSGLPADAACSLGSNTATLTAGSTVSTTLTVTTTVGDAALRSPQGLQPSELAPLTAAAVFPIELTGLGVFFAGLRRRKTHGTQGLRLFAILFVTLGLLGLAGCCFNNTTFKTYTINITGTSASSTVPTQSTSVLLSVGN